MALFEARGLTKAYRLGGELLQVLSDISFLLPPGEITVFVGKSGCGKSTLLRILAGLIKADAGDVRLEGKVVSSPTPGISILFQRYTVFPWMTVRGNVEAGLINSTDSWKERRRTAEQYLEMVGLLQYADERPSVLSGGMQQRVALARTYAMDPKVLLMDEPFAALDALTRREMQMELKRLNEERHKAAVFVTHDINEAILLANRICVLSVRPATIVAEFRPDSVGNKDSLYRDVATALDLTAPMPVTRDRNTSGV